MSGLRPDEAETSAEPSSACSETTGPATPRRTLPHRPNYAGFVLVCGLAYSIAARLFGWPLPNLGVNLAMGLLTESAIIALAMLAAFGIQEFRKYRTIEDNTTEIRGIMDLLEPDERLIWQGKPALRFFYDPILAQFLFGFIPLTFGSASLWICGMMIRQGKADATLAIALLPGIGFLLIGIYSISSPWRIGRTVMRSEYAITDRRVLVLRGIGWSSDRGIAQAKKSVQAYESDAIRRRARRRRSKSRVDLIFGREVRPAFDGSEKSLEIGILAISDWTEPERHLQEQFGQESIQPARLEPTIAGECQRAPFALRILITVVTVIFMLPWIAMGIGMILAGIRAIRQPAAAPGMAIGLPAGILLVCLIFGLGYYLTFVLPCRIVRRFEFDGIHLYFETMKGQTEWVATGSIRDVIELRHRRGGGLRGWRVRFFDRPEIELSASTTNSLKLVTEIHRLIAATDSVAFTEDRLP